MTSIPRLRAILTLVALALLGLAAPASAATITDPPNDADGDPGHDITSVDWVYDATAGRVSGTVTVAGDGGDAGILIGFTSGEGNGSECSGSDGVVLIGVKSITNAASYQVISGGQASDAQSATPTYGATTYRISATASELVNQPYTCVEAQLTTPDGSSTYDTAASAPAPPPAPTPTPAPTTAPPAPTPAPTPAPAAKLRATLKGVPAKVRRGRTFRPTLTIANRGTAAAPAMTVRVRAARGLSVKPRAIKVKGLAPGKAKRVKLRVALTRKARSATPLVIAARGKGVSAVARKTLRLKAKPKPKPKPRPSKGGLPGTFWWWNEFTANTPFNVFSLRFYDNGYAYYRLPDERQSVPDKCTSVTSVPDEDGEYGPGCVKWDLKGTTLTFSDPRFTGTYANGKLSIRDAEDTYEVDKLAEPQAGKRFNFSYKNIESTGICGPFSFCSITKSYLTLQDDGQFGLQEESTSTLDSGGSFTYAGSYPPESRGTYEVLPGYRIRLSYADGKSEVVPFGIVDGTSAVDSNVRVVLGRLPFWVEDENG